MITHLTALAAVSETVLPSYLHRAPTSAPSAFFVWMAPGWGFESADFPVCGRSDDLMVTVRLLCRATTGDAVAIKLQKARGLLSPSLVASPVVVSGRSAFVRFVRSEFVAPDLDIVMPGTDEHPFYGVDSYLLTSEAV